jgi:hypothetical protein
MPSWNLRDQHNLRMPLEVEHLTRDAGFHPIRRNTRYEILIG